VGVLREIDEGDLLCKIDERGGLLLCEREEEGVCVLCERHAILENGLRKIWA
jgi:hypothetical protein